MTLQTDSDNIRPLDDRHNRAAFSCGDDRLDRYLHTMASDQMRRRIAIVWAWTKPPSQEIIGYYTLTNTNLDAGELPSDVRKAVKLKGVKMEIGATLLGRFAIHSDMQSRGLGTMLCMDAFYKTLVASRSVASVGIILHARTDVAKRFWRKREFVSLGERQDGQEQFFMPMSYIEKLFAE